MASRGEGAKKSLSSGEGFSQRDSSGRVRSMPGTKN